MSVPGGPQSALAPHGPQAERIFDLSLVSFIGGAVIFALVIAFVAAALVLPARPGDEHTEDKPRRLLAVGIATALTVLTLIAFLVYSARTSMATTTTPRDPVRVEIAAVQWWWDITYPGDRISETVRTANELRIPVGRPVEITLTSRDVIHSLWIPNLHGKLDAIPGRVNHLWLQADRPGVYRGQCAEFCGLQHARMALHVVAMPPEEFERWRAHQAGPAIPPGDELARRGQQVFLGSSCAMCHAIRGTPAMASVGPDLTHLGSRPSLAAGTLPNRRGHLGGWILDPQQIKPGAFMPANEIEAEDLTALLHYLESLK